jgi:asparagine synthase (glutamine-hydrolysing)
MPMSGADGRLWITYNGEAYNYQELRAELGGGFQSGTDTETILRGYEIWGKGILTRLSGMYAFAIFEASPIPRMILARDRFGIKPVYYYRDENHLVFASEVRALLQSGLVPAEPNSEAIIRFLQVGSVPVPHTTIKGIQALPAAHSLIAQPERRVSIQKYWNLSAYFAQSTNAATFSRDDVIATIRMLLEDSVERHLISDVPLGVFLSGGVDSSALVALASRRLKQRLTTISMNFGEAAWSEARYAGLVAQRYTTDHREVVLGSQDLFERLPRFFSDMDEPTVNGVNAYFVARAAKSAGLTVVLSGTGGDEVFLGYDYFRRVGTAEGLRHALRVLPGWLRRGLVGAVARVGHWTGQLGGEKFRYLDQPAAERAYLLFRGLFGPREIARLLDVEEREVEGLGPLLPDVSAQGESLIDHFTLFEFQHYLQNQLLKDTDVMSMAHSVEVRVPYLDHRLVKYALSLPYKLKLAGKRPKTLLVDALGVDLPREISDRPKMGFTLPFDLWLRQRSEELERSCVEAELLQRSAAADVWRRFKAHRVHWSRAWALVVLAHFQGRQQRMAA